jgi:hypothetical protein
MRLTDLLAAGVQHLAGRKGVIILGVNKEDRRRGVVHGSKKPRSQFQRAIKAIAGSRENLRPPAGFKYLVTEMVCCATGGPQKCTGRSMVDSHAHLKITSAEWEAFLDDFQQTLDEFAVPAKEQAELKAIVNSTRSDIVVNSALAVGSKS